MAQNDEVKVLKFALLVGAIMSLVYGLGYLLIPATLANLSRGNPVEVSWLRWSGGVLVALAVGAFMVYSKPEKQKIFVTSIALANLLASLGLLYSWAMREYSGATWFIALPACLTLLVAALLFWGRSQAKGIL